LRVLITHMRTIIPVDLKYSLCSLLCWLFSLQMDVHIISVFVTLLASMATLNKLLRGQGREVVNNVK